MLSMDEAKAYLRVDSGFEDDLIGTLLASSESLCMDVARLNPDEWAAIWEYTDEDTETVRIRNSEKSPDEVLQMQKLLRVSVLFSLGYLYEHREEADHHELVLTLRNLLFSIREGVV